MSLYVCNNAVRVARRVNLYDFLLHRHHNDVKKEGNSLRLRDNNSVSVKAGYSGFTDFATNATGNPIKCLENYFGYEFKDAVVALCEFAGMSMAEITGQETPTVAQGAVVIHQATPERSQEPLTAPQKVFVPPEPLQGRYRQLYAYLTQRRGIPQATIQRLIDDKLLYQAATHGNMVFIDPARTFAELRGTNSEKSFHQVMFDPSIPAAFWWYKPRGLDTDPTVAYVCEGAIDAISLYLLLSQDPSTNADRGLYCSIGGVANQQRIDAIKAGMSAAGCQTIIAVDNDKAGEDCRQRNQDCKHLIPAGKDWNDDWLSFLNQKRG